MVASLSRLQGNPGLIGVSFCLLAGRLAQCVPEVALAEKKMSDLELLDSDEEY